MTRLFIQFYVGVLIVLFLAWYIHGIVLKQRSNADWARVVEEAHSGGARLVARAVDTAPAANRERVLDGMRERFDYSVTIVAVADLPNELQARIARGDDVASYRPGNYVVAALDDRNEAVRLGPFPNYDLKGIEESLGGWMRLTADELNAAALDQREDALKKLQERFDFPIEIIGQDDLPEAPKERISHGADVPFYRHDAEGKEQWFAATPLASGKEVVRFGPFPSFTPTDQEAATTTLAFVLLPAALAIALLLRPVAQQLRHVENAARSIAGGDLSARVDERKVKSARTLAQAFNNMASRTETMLRTQRELLQAVSHELRTPLSRIHFAIDLIREAKESDERNMRLDSLDIAAQELDDLVGELLSYVRLETSAPQLQLDEVHLLPLVNELIEKQALLHPAMRFEIGEQFSREEMVVRADEANLRRALGNLIANAGRFAKSRVVFRVRISHDTVVIDVDDDGPGIPEADRERIFDPFVRLDDSSRGAGLGLALVRRIVTKHGGQVIAQGSPLGGCRIRTTWPCIPSPSRVNDSA